MISPTELIGQNAATEWKRSETPLWRRFFALFPAVSYRSSERHNPRRSIDQLRSADCVESASTVKGEVLLLAIS